MAFTRKKIEIEGLKELNESLLDFSRATSGNILKRAASTAAAAFAEDAAVLAPKRFGALKRGIKVGRAKIIAPGKAAFAAVMQAGGSRAEAAQAARNANRTAGGEGRHVVADAGPTKNLRQAIPQEFGTARHPAHPYMRPAWDSGQVKYTEIMKDSLKEEIDKAAARAAKRAARTAAKMGK